MIATPEHKARVLAHQQIAALFSCGLEELFEIYQRAEPEDSDTTWLRMIYSIGQWRFGPSAWSARHTEYFKQRARENAAAGIPTPGKYNKRAATKLSLSDLGL
jgi:hypothetical protein